MKAVFIWTILIVGMIIAVIAACSWEFIVLFILAPIAIRSLRGK